MAVVKNDGNLRFGSRKIDIDKKANAINGSSRSGTINDVILNEVRTTRPTETTVRNDEEGQPDGQVTTRGIQSGSATAQLRANKEVPLEGDEFTEDFGWGSQTFYFDEIEINESNSGTVLKTFNVNFRVKLN